MFSSTIPKFLEKIRGPRISGLNARRVHLSFPLRTEGTKYCVMRYGRRKRAREKIKVEEGEGRRRRRRRKKSPVAAVASSSLNDLTWPSDARACLPSALGMRRFILPPSSCLIVVRMSFSNSADILMPSEEPSPKRQCPDSEQVSQQAITAILSI